MKRKLYLDIALLVLIFGGIGVFVFMQHAPATDTATQAPATGCCGGASMVEGGTPQATTGGCCGTPAAETAQSDNALQQQTKETTEASKAAAQTPQSDKADTGGCGCGSQ